MDISLLDWGTVPDWVVAITAMFGVGAGLYQLSAIRLTNYQTAQFERAKLLLEFDRDFESLPMTESRQKLLVIRNRFESEVAAPGLHLTAEQQIEEVARRISSYVSDVWRRSRTYDGDAAADKDSLADEYKLIMRVPGWCETLGHQCRRNLLPLGDVLDLYDQLIINTIGNLQHHIKLRSEEGPHKNQRYLENALWLYKEAEAQRAGRTKPIVADPSPSRIDWKG